jgi:hypothetical protein
MLSLRLPILTRLFVYFVTLWIGSPHHTRFV